MESPGIRQLREALKMAKVLGFTTREKRFNRASKVYWGKQYDDLEEWSAKGCPLRDKKPSVQVGLTKKAVNRVNAHLFGEGHAPTFKSESETLEEHLTGVVKDSGLERRYLELGRLGTLHGTVAIGFHVFEGRIDTEVINVGTSTPIFGRDERKQALDENIAFDDLLELRETWKTFKEDELGGVVIFWHRRDWTTTETIEYFPIEGPIENARDLEWRKDDELSEEHGLGFVPAEWITPIPVAHDIDGAPLVDEAEFLLEDEINYTLSQTGRGIRYNQEPTIVFTNVEAASSDAIHRGADNTLRVQADPGASGAGGQAKAELLEMNGTGATVAMAYTRLVRNLFNEIANVVEHDPEQFSGALSGVALERLLYPMVLAVENLRPEYEHKIGRLLEKMLKATKVPGADAAVVTAIWPPVVAPTAQDLQQYTTAVVQLLVEGVIDRKKAIEMLGPFIGVDDVDAFLAQVDAEAVSAGTTQVPGQPGTVSATVPTIPGTEGA